MTADLSVTLRRLQEQARREASPLVTDAERQSWDKYAAHARDVIAAILAALVAGRITVREFERVMAEQIRQSHAIAYAIARGGLESLTPGDRQRINTRVNGQIGYLAAWAAALTVSAGGVLLLAGKATSAAAQQARASLYIEAARASLSAGAAARVGLPDLPAWPGDGTTRCRVRCHCSWLIRQIADADWDCYWLLGFAEHCEHCPRRALAWAPLRVRNGVLQPYVQAGLFLSAA